MFSLCSNLKSILPAKAAKLQMEEHNGPGVPRVRASSFRRTQRSQRLSNWIQFFDCLPASDSDHSLPASEDNEKAQEETSPRCAALPECDPKKPEK